MLSAMGIGNSKMNAAEGETVPAKIRPTLVGTIEEIRKRMNGEGTLSKKKLLKDSDEDDDNSQSSHKTITQDNKVSSSKEIQIQSPKEEIPLPAIATENFSIMVPMPNSEGEIVKENQPNKDNMDQTQDIVKHVVEMAEAEVKTEEGNNAESVAEPTKEKGQESGAKGDDHDNDHDDDSDDEDESEEIGRLLCPGSPSFRIYCINTEENNEEECKSPTIIVHQKSHSVGSVETTASRNSNEVLPGVEIDSEPITKRKGHKKKFGAIKTLLKVKSCYHPMSTCTGNNKTIVPAKPTKRLTQ